jgi:hypothetical protein
MMDDLFLLLLAVIIIVIVIAADIGLSSLGNRNRNGS